MPAKPHKVGDHIRVNMRSGKIVDAVIKAVHDEFTDGARYQVDFGNNQTALISRISDCEGMSSAKDGEYEGKSALDIGYRVDNRLLAGVRHGLVRVNFLRESLCLVDTWEDEGRGLKAVWKAWKYRSVQFRAVVGWGPSGYFVAALR
jgi:hypothetical protein